MSAFPKNFILGVLITILIIATITFGVLWAQTKREARSKNQELGDLQKRAQELQTKITEQKPPASQIDTSSWKTYRNEDYGFELM